MPFKTQSSRPPAIHGKVCICVTDEENSGNSHSDAGLIYFSIQL